MADPVIPTLEEIQAMRARAVQAKHVPSGLAFPDPERLALFRDLDRLLDLVEPMLLPTETHRGLEEDDLPSLPPGVDSEVHRVG